jgi:hypothetical protein
MRFISRSVRIGGFAALLACSTSTASALEVTAGGKDASTIGLEIATEVKLGTFQGILETVGSMVNHMRICSLTGQAWDITTSACIDPLVRGLHARFQSRRIEPT